MPQKGRAKGKGKGPELVFDDKARAEYLTGFRKRKQERKQAGRDYLAKKAKEEQLAARKELRNARKEKAAENVREQRKAFGLDAEGESDLDGAAVDSDGDDDDDDEDDAVPQIQEQEYDSDQHHTHVVVEPFDPEQEAFDKAISTTITRPSKPENGQSQETSDPHQEENVSQQRLHLSGLTAAFSKEDLERRFSTFGTVVSIDGLGKRDALGQLRPFAYITLQAPPQQIKRCMNLLSGSVWKGATLRIGEAKPDYQQRIQLENEKRRREQEEKANNPKKPKRLPPGMGVESTRMEPVDQEAVESGLAWGWKRTPAGHLVRPLRMRPSHPLPRPSRASTLSKIDAAEGEEDDDDQPEPSSRRARVNPRPPTKAHRITIDPTRYGAIHLSGTLLESLAAETDAVLDTTSLGPGEWRCEEILHDDDHEEEKDHRLVRWQYTAKDGKVLHEEFTKIPVRVVPKRLISSATVGGTAGDDAEDVMAQLDFDRYSDAGSDGDLFSGFASSIAPAAKQDESKAVRATNSTAVDTADIDDLFADLPSTSSAAAAAADVNDLFSDLPSTLATPAQQPQPKRAKIADAVSTPSKKVKGTFVPGLDPDEDDPANFSDGYDEVAAAGPSQSSSGKQVADAEEERKKTLALLGEMFGSGSDDEGPSVDVAEILGESVEDESDSSSDSDTDSDDSSTDGGSEAAPAEAVDASSSSGSSSSSSSSESEDDNAIAVDEEETVEAAAEPEQDVSMADAPPVAVTAVAAPAMDAKTRRAAFLSSLSEPASSTQSTSYVPIARFDPGTRATSPPPPSTTNDALPATSAPSAPDAPSQPTTSVQTASAAPDSAAGTKVSMSTLKAMFKPQDRASSSDVAGFSLGLGGSLGTGESGSGLSLMDSLGLEFELEDEPDDVAQPIASSWTAEATTPSAAEPVHLPFFPSSSAAAWNNTGSVRRWTKPRSQEEKEADWTRYKESLTQVIKKRHREAARKLKRGFNSQPPPAGHATTGSARPQQQLVVQQAPMQ